MGLGRGAGRSPAHRRPGLRPGRATKVRPRAAIPGGPLRRVIAPQPMWDRGYVKPVPGPRCGTSGTAPGGTGSGPRGSARLTVLRRPGSPLPSCKISARTSPARCRGDGPGPAAASRGAGAPARSPAATPRPRSGARRSARCSGRAPDRRRSPAWNSPAGSVCRPPRTARCCRIPSRLHRRRLVEPDGAPGVRAGSSCLRFRRGRGLPGETGQANREPGPRIPRAFDPSSALSRAAVPAGASLLSPPWRRTVLVAEGVDRRVHAGVAGLTTPTESSADRSPPVSDDAAVPSPSLSALTGAFPPTEPTCTTPAESAASCVPDPGAAARGRPACRRRHSAHAPACRWSPSPPGPLRPRSARSARPRPARRCPGNRFLDLRLAPARLRGSVRSEPRPRSASALCWPGGPAQAGAAASVSAIRAPPSAEMLRLIVSPVLRTTNVRPDPVGPA